MTSTTHKHLKSVVRGRAATAFVQLMGWWLALAVASPRPCACIEVANALLAQVPLTAEKQRLWGLQV